MGAGLLSLLAANIHSGPRMLAPDMQQQCGDEPLQIDEWSATAEAHHAGLASKELMLESFQTGG